MGNVLSKGNKSLFGLANLMRVMRMEGSFKFPSCDINTSDHTYDA